MAARRRREGGWGLINAVWVPCCAAGVQCHVLCVTCMICLCCSRLFASLSGGVGRDIAICLGQGDATAHQMRLTAPVVSAAEAAHASVRMPVNLGGCPRGVLERLTSVGGGGLPPPFTRDPDFIVGRNEICNRKH